MAEMMVRENRVLKAMKEGRKALGYQMTFPSVWDVEILGPFGLRLRLAGWRAWPIRLYGVGGDDSRR